MARFPSADERLTRELASVLAFCGQPDASTKILAAIPKGDTNPALTIHLLSTPCAATTAGWTAEQKSALMDVYARAAQWRGGASFPGFINLLFESTIKGFSDAEKQMAYGKVPQFAPLTEAELAAAAASAARGPRAGGEPGHRAQPRHPRHQPRGDVRRADLHAAPDARPAVQGPAHFEQACAQCHRFGAIGTDFGPDLHHAGVAVQEARRRRGDSLAVAGGVGSVPERRGHDHRQADAVRPRRPRGRRQDRAADDAGRAADRNREGQGARRASRLRCR